MKKLVLLAVLIFDLNGYCQVTKVAEEVAFEVIENIPVYKGCDESMSNEDKRQCMSDKISDLVAKNFNTDIATKLKLPSGEVRISVIFKINTEGNIENIQARAKYHVLEDEAIRVVKMIPQMTPGYLRDKPVVVPYSLPIIFKVDAKNDSIQNKNFPAYRGCDETLGYEDMQDCTTKKIMDFVKVNSVIDEADKLFPTDRSTKFQASFIIDKKGYIKDINVKAHKREMAVLAIRALKQLPKMKAPGTINGKAVDVPFGFLMTLYFD